MLELRPTCERCHSALPPDSTQAMICTYECTFCRSCVENVLHNVCPNCGGGFCPRPIRPVTERVSGTGLTHHPASEKIVHKTIDAERHGRLLETLADIPPEQR